tara:strand:- start:369 stop:701 length:333 start_codon:yes stop_codon:yes gene_type:complete
MINIERRNKYLAAKLKATTERDLIRELIASLTTKHEVTQYPIHMTYTWHRKNKRTDPSNVAWGTKYVEDALQRAGVLRNDGPREIASITHQYVYGADENYVEVEWCSEPT